MKKLFLTCAAVVGISAVFAANAFAADPIVNDAGFSKTEGTYSVKSDLSAYTGQMTILIIPESIYTSNAEIKDEDIYYIDQTAAPASGSKIFQSVGILGGTTLKEGTSYIVKIGGENIAESGIIVEKFTVGGGAPTYYYGDVNLSGGYPDLDDAGEIISYVLWDSSVFDIVDEQSALRLKLGNISKDRETNDAVDLDDAGEIISYVLWDPSTLDDLITE